MRKNTPLGKKPPLEPLGGPPKTWEIVGGLPTKTSSSLSAKILGPFGAKGGWAPPPPKIFFHGGLPFWGKRLPGSVEDPHLLGAGKGG